MAWRIVCEPWPQTLNYYYLLSLRICLVGMVQGNLELVDVTLNLLLHPHSLSLSMLFCLQAGLHGVHGTGMVLPTKKMFSNVLDFFAILCTLPGVLKLIFFLGNPSINLLPDLGELQSSPQHLSQIQ